MKPTDQRVRERGRGRWKIKDGFPSLTLHEAVRPLWLALGLSGVPHGGLANGQFGTKSRGDILSDGSSCGGKATLPSCQADFWEMWRGGKPNKQSSGTISHRQPAQPSPAQLPQPSLGIHRSPRWNRKKDLNPPPIPSLYLPLFFMGRTEFFHINTLKGNGIVKGWKQESPSLYIQLFSPLKYWHFHSHCCFWKWNRMILSLSSVLLDWGATLSQSP